MHGKIDAELRRWIHGRDAQEVVTVVIELAAQEPGARAAGEEASPSRRQRIARRKAAFDERADELEAALERLEARALERAWINQTVKAAVPIGALAAVADLASVATIGMPRRIVAEDA